MALSETLKSAVRAVEHPHQWRAERQTPIAVFERDVVSHALKETRSHGLISPIITLHSDKPFGIAEIDQGKNVHVMEDEAYARLTSKGGREPDKFSWVPQEGMGLGNGKFLRVSVHENSNDPSLVFLEHDSFDSEGNRYMRVVYAAPRTERYDRLLGDPIKSEDDAKLSSYITLLKRPAGNEVIEFEFGSL